VVATASFQTSADVGIGHLNGTLQAIIFVDIIPATRGARDKLRKTDVPMKP
jgi:hypothetical protein